MKPVAYIAHALRGDEENNRAKAARWAAWAASVGLCPQATWIVLSSQWTEEEGRELGLELDCMLIERCDILMLCGERLSDGMLIEAGHASKCRKTVYDLTGMNERECETYLRSEGVIS